jgi:ABC-type Mn2+/Zn2+ transport system permease subunit
MRGLWVGLIIGLVVAVFSVQLVTKGMYYISMRLAAASAAPR